MKETRKVRSPKNVLVWVIPVMALAVMGGFLAGERSGGGAPAGGAGASAAAAAGPGQVDLSAMSPDERASHLYDLVMRLGENGKLDSARSVAPAALRAYEALGAPDAHTRYDVGMIAAVTGDSVRARAEAGKILEERPTHLLGLMLAMRTAATPAVRAAYQRRFLESNQQELAAPLPEYGEHKHDIEGALAAARAAKK